MPYSWIERKIVVDSFQNGLYRFYDVLMDLPAAVVSETDMLILVLRQNGKG